VIAIPEAESHDIMMHDGRNQSETEKVRSELSHGHHLASPRHRQNLLAGEKICPDFLLISCIFPCQWPNLGVKNFLIQF
jgi:hypothetical protein